MNSTSPEPSPTMDYGGKDNRSYAQSSSDSHLPTLNEEENTDVNLSSRATSSSSFPIIYEAPIFATHMTTSGPPPSASSANFTDSSDHKSSVLGPNERHLSILDPMSDRVSTILVWQNLTVHAKKNKRQEFFQRMKSYKNFVPTRKSLLSNTSGAIAGGLWAVMGQFFFSDTYSLYFQYNRSLGFW